MNEYSFIMNEHSFTIKNINETKENENKHNVTVHLKCLILNNLIKAHNKINGDF